MEFLKRVRRYRGDRLNDPVFVGKYMMSIQCSSSHHCFPREDGLPLCEYESMEVMITPKIENLEPKYAKYLDVEMDGSTLLAFVPVDKIEEIYQTLKGENNDNLD